MYTYIYIHVYISYILLNRYDSTENWSSGTRNNCILSTIAMNPLDIVKSSMIANDKDWDLYQYDRGGQTCRDELTDYGSLKGNTKYEVWSS